MKKKQGPPLPKHNMEAEQACLGSLLLGGADGKSLHADIIAKLQPEAFWRESHRTIYEAILAVNEEGRAPDIILVADELDRRGQLEQAGNRSYLTALILAPGSWLNGLHYAGIVARLARERKAQEISLQLYAASQCGWDAKAAGLQAKLDELTAHQQRIQGVIRRPNDLEQ